MATQGQPLVQGNRIYLAGPDVFLPDAAELARAKREICARHGFVGVSPVDGEVVQANRSKNEIAYQIGVGNEALIRSCHLVIANITPFRGPSADVGTAYEMGFARALGLRVLAYTDVAGDLLTRTTEALGRLVTPGAVGFVDQFGMAIEDFEQVDNLMLTTAVQAGDAVVVVKAVDMDKRFRSLDGFEECVRLAARL